MPFSPVQRRAALVLLSAGMYGAGWWHHHLLHPQPPSAPTGHARTQLPPPSAHPPGYLTSKAPPAPPAAGAEALTKLLEQRAKPEDLATALAAWAEQDPDAAFRALLADPRLQLPATARALFEVLGKKDPTQALQRLAQLPAVPWARDANRGLATGWTQRDPEACAAAGLALPPSTPRADFLKCTFAQWLKQDLTAAHDWFLTLPLDESRNGIINDDTMAGLQIQNPGEMAKLLELSQRFPDAFGFRISKPFKEWATKSPEAALQWTLSLSKAENFTGIFLSIALKPLAADPARVLSLLEQIHHPRAQVSLVDSAADAWVQRDPASGWAWSAQLTDPSLRNIFENSLAVQWSQLDPGTAIPWLSKNQANQLGNLDQDDLKQWAGATPDAALAMLRQLPADNSRVNLTANLLEGIAFSKPAVALSQLDLLETSGSRGAVLVRALRTWSAQDITAASDYTNALALGQDRQAAIKGILPAAFKEEPESAMSWALSLTNPKDKEESVSSYLSSWRKQDPAAAQNWLDHAPLDDDLRQKLTPSQP
jgi:hypothetical protein